MNYRDNPLSAANQADYERKQRRTIVEKIRNYCDIWHAPETKCDCRTLYTQIESGNYMTEEEV